MSSKPKRNVDMYVDIKPEQKQLPSLARKDFIASAFARFPLIPKLTKKVSTFTATTFNYYEAVHYMDSLMTDNLYFERSGLLWHPFVSRLYFGALVYIQTFRAMDYAKVGDRDTISLHFNLIRDFPPERLPIPGPLVPMLKELCACEPDDKTFHVVYPYIEPKPGPRHADELLPREERMLGLPNLPVIAGFANTIINADGIDVPDYTVSNMFDDTEDHDINGVLIPANAWNMQKRSILYQPGMAHVPETNEELDERFSLEGDTYSIPVITEDTTLQTYGDYTMLNNPEWLGAILPVMSLYSQFFKESTNLGQCSPFVPLTGTIRTRPTTVESNTAALNGIYHLDEALPDEYPYKLIYDQRSYEMAIPQFYQLMGQYSCINTMCDYRGMDIWSRINTIDSGRPGPYWSQNPSISRRGHHL